MSRLARLRPRGAAWIGVALALIGCVGVLFLTLGPNEAAGDRHLLAAADLLQQAIELDQLAGNDHNATPTLAAGGAKDLYRDARRAYQAAARRLGQRPAVDHGLSQLAWRLDGDLERARQGVDTVVEQLEGRSDADLSRPAGDGRNQRQVLAEALADRASYRLLAGAGPHAAEPTNLPPDLLRTTVIEALGDIDRAIELDDRLAKLDEYRAFRGILATLDRELAARLGR